MGNKLIIGLFVLALVGYGAYQTTQLPIDAVPDITNNQVQVITVAPALGATDIERLITFPIEQANSNIAGMEEIRSFSRFGLSLVTIVFNDETDLYWARQQVTERLQKVQTQIPQGLGIPELGPISTGLGEIYQYVVKPKAGFEQKYDATELRTMQDWIVRRQLLGVKGIAEVSSFGGKLKQYEIAINPNRLNANGITIKNVFDAIESNNQNTGGSYIEKGPTVLFIRSEGLIANKTDIENIAIKHNSSGTPLFVRDIAEVKIGYATRFGAMCYNDEGEVAGAIVMMLKGANSSTVIKAVKERIVQIQNTLPEGVEIEPFLDRTKMVNNAIATVEKNLLEGALIVVFVLVLFLGNFRAGLLVASVIPLAMLFAISMMNLFGVSGNLMSLGALDFGLIVDGAVIIVESVMHSLTVGNGQLEIGNKQLINSKGQLPISKIIKSVFSSLSQSQMDSKVNQSASKMMNSAVFGQIIILIVYLPIFTLQGIEGKMFKPMAQTVAFALLGAFILSLTYIPMMSAVFLSKNLGHKKNLSDRMMEKIEAVYQNTLIKILRIPKVILSFVIVLFFASAFILTRLGGEFIPALEEGDFAVDTRVLTGSSLNTTIEYTQKAAHILKTQFPEVEKIVTKIGSGEVPTDPMPMEASDLMIILKDKDEWSSAKTFNELSEKMSAALEAVPGITAGFQYPVQMRFNELMTGARQDVVCKIFGENLDSLAKTAEKLGHIVNTVQGTRNLYVEQVTGMPQILIEYNRPAIAQNNATIAEVNKVINTAFAGQSTGLVFEEEKRFDLIVRLDLSQKKDLEDVENLLIPTPNGNQIPLKQLANVTIKDGPNQIQREDAKRRIVVGFNIKDRDVQSIVNELQAKVDQHLKLPIGYYVTYGGSFENLNKAKNRLMIAIPVSLILIFLLLFFAFNSVKQGLLIYSAIPLSAIGGILLLAARSLPFSISAGVGFIALFGVAVLNGIVLIAEFNRLKENGMKNLASIVIKGTKLRLRPVLMTAFVASFGFLPMALSNGSGAEVQRPLATVVIGGLLVATFLTLFVLPILYVLFEKGYTLKKTSSLTSIIVAVLFLGINKGVSQQKIDIKTAIEIAIKNNLSLINERTKSNYANALIKTSKNVPNSNFLGDFGQVNSTYFDTRIGVSQILKLPKTYNSQQSLFTEEWKASQLNEAIKEKDLKRIIAQIFSNYLVQNEKLKIFQKIDSIYQNLLQKANLRLQKGESNILEKTTFEIQQNTFELQKAQIQSELIVWISHLQLILNAENQYIPVDNFKINNSFITDNLSILNHPNLQFLTQNINIAKSNTAVEQSKLLPEFSVGYNNGSFRGIGPDEKAYKSLNRFHSLQFGLGIPIFKSYLKEKIKASKINETIAENNLQIEKNGLNNLLEATINQQKANLKIVSDYENFGLKNVEILNEVALKQLNNGEINYLDFVQLINQNISVQLNYFDAVGSLNESTIQLNYLSNK